MPAITLRDIVVAYDTREGARAHEALLRARFENMQESAEDRQAMSRAIEARRIADESLEWALSTAHREALHRG